MNRCSPRRALRLTAGTFAAAILSGCTDDPAGPVRSADSSVGYQAATDVPPLMKLTPEPSFHLEVEAVGSFKPGHPVHLTLSAKANSDVHDGELRVTLPEVASAEESNWDVVVMAVEEEFRPHIEVRQSFSAGDRIRERVTVNIPEPGYYHVSATGYRHSSEAEPGRLADVSRQDYWLWIAEQGGKLTTTYDTTLFSPDDRRQTGPRGSQRRPSRVRSKGANITCTLLPGDDGTVILQSGCPSGPGPVYTPPNPPATATFKVLYTRSDRGLSNRPVPGARYTWNIVSTTNGATVGSGAGAVWADGTVGTIDCQGPTSERRISFTVYTLSEKANVKWGGLGELAYSQGMACGGHSDVQINPEMAHLFLSAVKIYDNHGPTFNTFTNRIYVGLYDDNRTYYHHNHPDRELHISREANMIYGEHGVMVLTHEHGHHYQHSKLFTSPEQDGLMRFQRDCARVHPPQSDQNMGCSFGEAFADWYAVVVRRGELPTWENDLEKNNFYRNCVNNQLVDGEVVKCNIDGSRIQGAIAAMLWDLSDSGSEYHDRIQIHPWQIADRMKTCRVRVGSNWYAYDGVDHLIYCLEGRSPYQLTVKSAQTYSDVTLVLFGSRSQSQWPAAVNSGVILPNNDDFRLLWLTNLYSKVTHVGQYPEVRRSVESEPTTVPPGDGGGDGGGGCVSLECPIIH